MILSSSRSALTILVLLISRLTVAFIPSGYYFDGTAARPSIMRLFMSDPIPVPDPAFVPPPSEPVPGVPDIPSPVPMPQVPNPTTTPVPGPDPEVIPQGPQGPEVVPPPAVEPKRGPMTM